MKVVYYGNKILENEYFIKNRKIGNFKNSCQCILRLLNELLKLKLFHIHSFATKNS